MSYDYPSLREHFVNGARRGDLRWSHDLPPDELRTLWAVKLEDERKADIKNKAGEIILARYPSWKQANLQARFTELVDKVQSGGTLTAQEQMEKDGIKSAWAWAKLVRSESDRLEADPNATANWPA